MVGGASKLRMSVTETKKGQRDPAYFFVTGSRADRQTTEPTKLRASGNNTLQR